MKLEVIPVEGLPEIVAGNDLAPLIAERAALRDGDVVVVTQKIVSKAEGRVVEADPENRDRDRARWVERESERIVARRGDVVIAQTRHGFVCANAGVDASNVAPDRLALLPDDPDASAAAIRDGLKRHAGVSVAVVVSDTFGRPWRVGQTNVAIGCAGMPAIRDHVGQKDSFGMVMQATQIAVADEVAAAAELVMGKTDGIPVAIVRGLDASGSGTASSLVRDAADDLFRTGVIED